VLLPPITLFTINIDIVSCQVKHSKPLTLTMWEQPKTLILPIEISKSFMTLKQPLDWFAIVSNPMFLLNVKIGSITWFII
jgi:hypothetical protein